MDSDDLTRYDRLPAAEWLAAICMQTGEGNESEADALHEHARMILQSIVDSLPLNILVKDRTGRWVFASRGYLELMSVGMEEILNKTDFDLFSSGDARQFSGEDAQVLQTGAEFHAFAEHTTPGGKAVWVERLKQPLRNEKGEIVGVQVLCWDATKQYLAEQERNFDRDLLRTLMDNIPDCIYFKDRESRFLRVNRAMLDRFGLESHGEAVGKSDADIFTEEHAQQALDDEKEIMRTGAPLISGVERETWPNRDDTWVLTTKVPLRNSEGEIVGTFGISRDITELKQTQDELQIARDAANAANQAKSDFLANVSHEIRTPMNHILGMTELILHTELTKEQHEYQKIVKESAELLLGLLNSILDFSKIEAGELELERIPFPFKETLTTTLNTLSLRASQKNIELTSTISDGVPDLLAGDQIRLQQIFVNLVGNAIKFTESGKVTVEVEKSPCEGPEILLRCCVRDTGPGISPEAQKSIFTAFRQADTSTTRRYGGTGLGLAITSQLVQMMGGRIWVESKLDEGSAFYFTAYFDNVSEEDDLVGTAESSIRLPYTAISERPVGFISRKILLAEDGLVNQKVAKSLLIKRGHQVTVANNGDEAIRSLSSDNFDVVLMDIQMPIMDGIEATKEIRKKELGADQRIPIIAMTAHALKGDRERCLDAGMDDYISKPFQPHELFALVESLTEASSLQRANGLAGNSLSKTDGVTPDSLSINHNDEAGKKHSSPYDRNVALTSAGGDESLLKEIAELFVQECPKQLNNISQAYDEDDNRALSRAAHTLKGSAAMFGADGVRGAAVRIEKMAANNQLAEYEEAWRVLEKEAEFLVAALKQL